jgi:hypothetical protein
LKNDDVKIYLAPLEGVCVASLLGTTGLDHHILIVERLLLVSVVSRWLRCDLSQFDSYFVLLNSNAGDHMWKVYEIKINHHFCFHSSKTVLIQFLEPHTLKCSAKILCECCSAETRLQHC